MTKIKIQSKSNRLSNEYCKIVPFNNFYELRLEIADSVFRIFGQYSKHQAVIAARYVGRALNKFLKKETEALQTELTVLRDRVAVLEKHIIAVHEMVSAGEKDIDILAVFNTPETDAAPCPNCGGTGPHFVPPSLGSEGFFTCKARPETL